MHVYEDELSILITINSQNSEQVHQCRVAVIYADPEHQATVQVADKGTSEMQYV
jgi:hypothetical protein